MGVLHVGGDAAGPKGVAIDGRGETHLRQGFGG